MVSTMVSAKHHQHVQVMALLEFALVLLLLVMSMPLQAEETGTKGFDHFATGFPLIGRHEHIDCADCHVAGQFKGTPLDCGLCHNGIRAPGKNLQHFPSSNFCEDCHTEYTWQGAKFDHSDVFGECQDCHNNILAIGKSPSHILSTSACEDCHNTISFDHVGKVDHASVIGSCSSCHNGVTATGKPADHPETTEECNSCHSVYTWQGADD